jgi:hypothetical protein
MGIPPDWHPYVAASAAFANTSTSTQLGGTALAGVYYDLLNPFWGALGVAGEGYAGGQGGAFEGGARLFAAVPLLFLQAGADYSATQHRTDFILSAIFPVIRGGFFRRGGQIRLDWLPTRGQTFYAGVQFPIFQPWVGHTRQYDLFVRVPKPPKHPPPRPPAPSSAALDSALAQMRDGARWLTRLSFVFWDDRGGSYKEGIARADSDITEFKDDLAERDAEHPDGHNFAAEMALYHGALARAFALATPDTAAARKAYAVMFGDVIVPYDHNFGQYKAPETLMGFGAIARARYAAWLRDSSGVAPEGAALALHVFDQWLAMLESIRTVIDEQSEDDPRLVWIPLQLGLRARDYDTQAKIDAVLEQLTHQTFTRGNASLYLDNKQFQFELARMILSTRHYMVLWIHEYAGVNHAGQPDSIGWAQTMVYLRALTRNVRDYDRQGTLPTYMIMTDAYFSGKGRGEGQLWLSMLERPLSRSVKLPKAYAGMQRHLAAAQDTLRRAVAASARLQDEAAKHGGARWLEDRIRVYVNFTFPSDFTFRTSHLLGVPIMSDNLMVDHRKLAFRDVTEADPAEGEALYGGVGVGQHYASATWEDRALLISGPALVSVKTHARETLLLNGFAPAQIPWFLEPVPVPPDYAAKVAALEAAGATGIAMEAQNETGFAQKDASITTMALYNLMPAGSMIVVPSSIWSSVLWAAQLGSAALRGCHVYIIAPSAKNASAGGEFLFSRQSEVFARLITMSSVLKDDIAASGGALHIGIYERDHDLADVSGSLRHVAGAYRAQPFLRAEFPFPVSQYAKLDAAADSLDKYGLVGQRIIGDIEKRDPLLHRKTQFFATRATLDAIAGDSAIDGVFRYWILNQVEHETIEDANVPIQARPERQLVIPLIAAFDRLPDTLRGRSVLFSAVGSINKDARAVYLDGEVQVLLAGPEGLWSWPDYFMMFGWCTWVGTVAEMDSLVPPQGKFVRWGAYRVRRVL